MAPPKKRGLPKPLPEGFILYDTEKKKWRLGKIIGQGGFGLIYLASQDVDRPVAVGSEFVIKVEYQENGPLFSELKFYQRAAKPESIEKWKRSKKLDFLGIPMYWGSGLAEHKDLRYRFMVMDRLGSDLQKICERNGGRLSKATVLQLGKEMVTVLEYIHENEYAHADIKAANLMLGYRDPQQVYLADYGMSYRYCPDGVHKEYKENPRKGHNGTIEYTSLDAHKGLAPSRRGDLQILGFCLLHWLCGSLPWGNVLMNPTQVQEAKARLMNNLPDSVQQLSVSRASTDEVAAFLLCVKTLGYQDKPDYQYLRMVLGSAVKGRLNFSTPQKAVGEVTEKMKKLSIRKKEAGQAGRRTRVGTASTDEDHEHKAMKSKPVPACYIRGPPLTKPQAQQKEETGTRSLRARDDPVTYMECDTDDEDDEEEEAVRPRPKPISPRYLRGPPLPATLKEETGSRSLRRRHEPITYMECDTDDEDEEEARPRPLAACYLRRPPTSPRSRSKQETASKWAWGTKVNHWMALERCSGRHILTNQTHVGYREGWDERLVRQGTESGHRQRWGSDLCGFERAGSVLRGPEQEAAPTQRTGLFSWCFFGAVVLFFSAILVHF